VTDHTDADLLAFSIRLSAAQKQGVERIAAKAGMSGPMFVEAMLAALLADDRRQGCATRRPSPGLSAP
jgi:hypothetical protein